MRPVYICSCPCHSNKGMFHNVPCCNVCYVCDERIKRGWFEKHLCWIATAFEVVPGGTEPS